MGLYLEPGKAIPVDVDGETFYVRTLTAREQMRLLGHAEKLNAHEDVVQITDELWALLKLGLCQEDVSPVEDDWLDTVSIMTWRKLSDQIVEVNGLGIDDSKNSPASSAASSDT